MISELQNQRNKVFNLLKSTNILQGRELKQHYTKLYIAQLVEIEAKIKEIKLELNGLLKVDTSFDWSQIPFSDTDAENKIGKHAY